MEITPSAELSGVLKNQIKRKVKRLLAIREEVKEIEQEFASLTEQTGQKLQTLNGSGTVRHLKTKSGNRRLNMAIHGIALSQISRSGNAEAKTYFQRKLSEGKTKAQALCCLKRRLVDIIFMMLKHKQEYNYTK